MQVKKLPVILFFTTLLATVAVASAIEIESIGVEVHGFASQGFAKGTRENDYIISNSGKGSFQFNEFGLNASKEIIPDLRIGAQIYAQERGNYGHDRVTLDWGYADYRFRDWLGFRAGKIKNPIGLYGDSRDTDSLRTFVFLPQPVYEDGMRDLFIAMYGGGVYGTILIGKAGELAYQAQVGTLLMSADDGTALRAASKIMEGMPTTLGVSYVKMTDMDPKLGVVHSLEWRPPVPGLRLVASGFHGSMDAKAYTNAILPQYNNLSLSFSNYKLFNYGFEQTWRDLVVAGEFSVMDFKTTSMGRSSASNLQSWYISATYQLTDWLQPGIYYTERYSYRGDWDGSKYHAATGRPAHNAYSKDLALALKFDPLKYVTIKMEGHLIEGTAMLDASEFMTAKKHSYLFATKLTLSF